ncbi:MAG TPA: RDD family protein [Methylovirgula sp.]
MFDTSGFQRSMSRPLFAPANLPAEALAGVRTRRILALCVDFLVVSCLVFLIWLALLVATLGLSFFILPPLFPLIAFFYNGLSVSGRRMATPGMRMMDLEMRLMDGDRVPFLNAAVHAVLFYISWLFPVVFLVSLLATDKRCLHDMLAGVIVVRRPLGAL